MQTSNEWLDVQAAAEYIGKSVSTLRRWIAQIEAGDGAGGNIRRQPFTDKGGEKILVHRAFLAQCFGVTSEQPEAPDLPGLLSSLEKQLSAKDSQIFALMRDGETKNRLLEQEQQNAANLAERLREMSALNAALHSRLMSLTAGNPEERAPLGSKLPPAVGQSPFYFVALSVLLSACAVLLLYLLLF